MPISFRGFTSSEHITIRSDSYVDAARVYGRAMRPFVSRMLEERRRIKGFTQAKIKATRMYASLRGAVRSPAMIVGGINRLERYVEAFEGFRDGAGISAGECAVLQSEIEYGCQTVFVQHKKNRHIGILHTEENFDDVSIRHFYERQFPHPERDTHSDSPTYAYRVVTAHVGGQTLDFFGYPGLCFGGPSMGVNRTTRTFLSTDTLHIPEADLRYSLWVNAVAFMMLDIGDINANSIFAGQLSESGLAVFGGYAINMAQGGRVPKILSVECARNFYAICQPRDLGDRLVIARSNLAEDAGVSSCDEMNPDSCPRRDIETIQTVLEFQRRKERLTDRAAAIAIDAGSSAQVLEVMRNEMREPGGDVETNEFGKEYTGYVTPVLAGYAVGGLDRLSEAIEICKLWPAPFPDRPYRVWYDAHSNPAGYGQSVDLRSLARKYARKQKR